MLTKTLPATDGYASDQSFDDQDPFGRLTIVGSNPVPEHSAVGKMQYALLDAPIELAQDLSGGCGGKTWEAADVMVNYILWKQQATQGEFFRGKRVLELGAGTGLVGLAVAKGCTNVDKVIITDQLPLMHLMKQNIELNQLGDRVDASILDWGVPLPAGTQLPDVVLASDCVYLEIAFKPLLDTLVDLSTKDTAIYLSYRKRRRADRKFFQMARKKFDMVEVLDDPNRETYLRDNFKLYLMKRKC